MSRMVQNGFLTDALKMHRGCRQGDSLSSYVYIICAEMLSMLVRNNKGIKCITIDGTKYLISQYADDTTFILNESTKSLNNTIRVLN